MNHKSILKLILVTSLIFSLFQTVQAADSDIEQAVLVHINQYRQQHGLGKLVMDNRITKEARKHSIDMANHTIPFGHQYFNKRIDTIHAKIKNSNAGAENVAYNYKDAQDVVNNWVKSPGHKTNIVGNYNLTGIGIARDKKGKIYFTQIFLRTGSSGHAVKKPFPAIFRKLAFSFN